MNDTPDVHPIHLHQVEFQVLDRTPLVAPFDPNTFSPTLGSGVDENEMGWKDTVIAYPGEITTVIQAKFEDALHGRADEYREWLDPVGQASKVSP